MREKLFQNKTVVISGGLGDIGRAIAKEFAKGGANIAMCGNRDRSAADGFISELEAEGVKADYMSVDVSDADAVDNWINQIQLTIGIPEIIIANAATVTMAPVTEITPAQWSREIRVNLDGAFYLAQNCAQRLLKDKLPGRIVFIGSWAGHVPHPHIPAYSVAKAGMRMLCKCMALELAPQNILVNEIAPGFVQAGLSAKVWEENPEMNDSALEKVPVKKIMTAEDVAIQTYRLCLPDNLHMTGSTILMDGGLSLLS